MAGTVKIWWHDGGVRDVRYNGLPVVHEPERGFESLAVGSSASASGPAPSDTVVALIESDVNLRYVVRPPSSPTNADPVTSKPMTATGLEPQAIGVMPGYSISFVEI